MIKILDINTASTEPFTQGCRQRLTLDGFLANRDLGGFIKYEGFVKEVLLDGRIIADGECITPSELKPGSPLREQLLAAQKANGPLELVWYSE